MLGRGPIARCPPHRANRRRPQREGHPGGGVSFLDQGFAGAAPRRRVCAEGWTCEETPAPFACRSGRGPVCLAAGGHLSCPALHQLGTEKGGVHATSLSSAGGGGAGDD